MPGLLYNLGDMIVPASQEEKLTNYFKKTGKATLPYPLFGGLTLVGFLAGVLLFFFIIVPTLGLTLLTLILVPILIIASIIFFYVVVYMYFEIHLFRRREKIEKVLPDFLESVAVNLRAGMTFDNALWNAIEPDYDVLADEIEIVAKKVMTGEDTEQALNEFASKYDSPLLRESIDLITVGLRSGGEISDLIDRVVENVKQVSFLKKELIANIMSYVIFITMISVFIAPTLYALSFNLMVIIQDLGTKITASAASDSAFSGLSTFGEVVIEREDFINFSHWSIIIISVTSSIIIADLREGSIKGSIKYVLFFIGLSYLVYEAMFFVFTSIFGGMVV